MKKTNLILALMVLSILILINLTVIFANLGPKAALACNGDCHAKICAVGGQDCVCCLIISGKIECYDCGAVDCDQ